MTNKLMCGDKVYYKAMAGNLPYCIMDRECKVKLFLMGPGNKDYSFVLESGREFTILSENIIWFRKKSLMLKNDIKFFSRLLKEKKSELRDLNE